MIIHKLVIVAGLTLAVLSPAVNAKEAEAAVQGSIHVTGKVPKAERVAKAKISFDTALLAAHHALPGKVINGALEAEDGNLQYAFEVLNSSTGKIDEVAIDAGNGKVLTVDRDDKD